MPTFEPLEPRQLFSATTSLNTATDTLTVRFTEDNRFTQVHVNAIAGNRVEVRVNHAPFSTFAADSFSRIDIRGSRSHDAVTVNRGVRANVTASMGNGSDVVRLHNTGNHAVRGGADRDVLEVTGWGTHRVSGDAGNDDIHLGGYSTANGGTGDDLIVLLNNAIGARANGNSGNDTFRLTSTHAATLNGGADVDTVHYTWRGVGVYANLAAGQSGALGRTLNQRLSDIENLTGTRQADHLIGDHAANRLHGDLGDDYINGQGGDDTINGSYGDDVLIGAAGHDRIIGEYGDDRMHGGDGNDTISDSPTGSVHFFRSGNNHIWGGGGQDRIFGGADTDIIDAGSGNDRVEAGGGDDRILGNRGRDHLDGGHGDDFIVGGDDADVLIGGFGSDVLRDADGAAHDRIYGHLITGTASKPAADSDFALFDRVHAGWWFWATTDEDEINGIDTLSILNS